MNYLADVRTIGVDVGTGQSADIEVIRRLFSSARVVHADHEDAPQGRVKINVHVEHFKDQFVQSADFNIFKPNAEFTKPEYISKPIDLVICKTHHCHQVMRERFGSRAVYVGWESPDVYDPGVEKKKQILHVAGHSFYKSTAELILAAAKVPNVPITVTCSRPSILRGVPVPNNVRLITQRLSRQAMNKLQNESLIHVCPSRYEGFGHYIHEAKSVGAFILTTMFQPMVEFVSPEFGMLVRTDGDYVPSGLVKICRPDVSDLADCLAHAWSLPAGELEERGKKSREHFHKQRSAFRRDFRRRVCTGSFCDRLRGQLWELLSDRSTSPGNDVNDTRPRTTGLVRPRSRNGQAIRKRMEGVLARS